MRRVLYVVNIPRFFVSHRLPLARSAQQAGYEVHVATSDHDLASIAKIKSAGLTFHPLPLAQHGMNPLAELRTAWALVSLYRTLRPDLVHHVSIKPVLYGGLASRWVGIRATVSMMTGLGYVFISDDLKRRLLRTAVLPFLRVALGGNTHMIFQNPDDRARFMALGLIRSDRARLIRGSGVDVAEFSPSQLPNGKPIVLFAGRLMWQKGLGVFAEVARQLKEKARFVVVGYSESTSPDMVSESQLEAWQSEGILEWWGKRDDMPDVFAQATVVCLPSMYGEGVPKVLIEAGACARPIVTTDTPGCREVVMNDENGYLVPPNEAPALANAIELLVTNRALCERMGQAGRILVEREFALERVVTETFALYEELLA